MTPDAALRAVSRIRASEVLGRAGPRSEAMLLRSALEGALSDWLCGNAKGAQAANFSVQLQVLHVRFPDSELAGRVAWTWDALSRATHFNGYVLPPGRKQLDEWEACVREFVAAVCGSPGHARV